MELQINTKQMLKIFDENQAKIIEQRGKKKTTNSISINPNNQINLFTNSTQTKSKPFDLMSGTKFQETNGDLQ